MKIDVDMLDLLLNKKRLFLSILLLTTFLLGGTGFATSSFAGRHFYFTLLASNLKYPIFTKEFSEGEGIVSVGGNRDIWLPDQQKTLGVRVGYENIRNNRAGLGMSLTYWRTEFDDAAFRYDQGGSQSRIAEYRTPIQTLLFLDLTGVYIPWEAGWQALGFYGLLGLVADYEQYYIDKFSTLSGQSEKIGLESDRKTGLDTRLGFGFGARLYFSDYLSLWVEKRWVVGETFSTDRTVVEGGFFKSAEQKTLYEPISSLGLAISF